MKFRAELIPGIGFQGRQVSDCLPGVTAAAILPVGFNIVSGSGRIELDTKDIGGIIIRVGDHPAQTVVVKVSAAVGFEIHPDVKFQQVGIRPVEWVSDPGEDSAAIRQANRTVYTDSRGGELGLNRRSS